MQNEEDKIKCDYERCLAGMGLAGTGKCFMRGSWEDHKCPRFRDEEKEYNKFMERE